MERYSAPELALDHSILNTVTYRQTTPSYWSNIKQHTSCVYPFHKSKNPNHPAGLHRIFLAHIVMPDEPYNRIYLHRHPLKFVSYQFRFSALNPVPEAVFFGRPLFWMRVNYRTSNWYQHTNMVYRLCKIAFLLR
ncbi:hypothetical protein D3C80_1352240 [compost metagenome]